VGVDYTYTIAADCEETVAAFRVLAVGNVQTSYRHVPFLLTEYFYVRKIEINQISKHR